MLTLEQGFEREMRRITTIAMHMLIQKHPENRARFSRKLRDACWLWHDWYNSGASRKDY